MTVPWDRLPRRHYIDGPTPLEPLERLSAALGAEIWIKRDDLSGLGGGGNKVRKLEFLVADALAGGARTLITTGAVQSNHCRLTAAAAAREGLACALVLEERIAGSWAPRAPGNPLLDDLFGVAEIVVVPAGADGDAAMLELAERCERPYVIKGGGSTPLGAVGYAAMTAELDDRFDHVVVASGSGGTHAGILIGGLTANVTGVSVGRPRAHQEELVHALAQETAALLGTPAPPRAAVVVDDRFVGPGYAVPTDAMVGAVRMVAELEGVLLDPVYTGKAMAGLIALARAGELGRTVCFVHTGGSPVLHAYAGAF
ncbi:MAG: D-cysteine desulfhydrase family protein [Acidimicrobiales bacterium]